ncbi:hypothetical protein [Symbioplanes lichenis]|uniref:hypothetical protein n=1 Tax=Symbioplanes lichenis TaxID=1629072 RepID=UPI002738D333|nr:hypothetical protein [Actinoplanes lichenis]
MSEIPWWGLPLVAVVFALLGAGLAVLFQARDRFARARAARTERWYSERRDAYVALLAQFERSAARLRLALDSGQPMPASHLYLDETGPALMRVRLLASGPVRSAVMAVHLLLEKVYAPSVTPPPGVDSAKAVREMLGHVPLVMQELEAAVREELEIRLTPPPALPEEPPGRSLRLPSRKPKEPVES